MNRTRSAASPPRSATPSPLGRLIGVMRNDGEPEISTEEQRGMARRLYQQHGVLVLWPGDGNAFQQAAIKTLARQLYGDRGG